MITEPTRLSDEVMAAKIFQSLCDEQRERRQQQRLQDEMLDAAEPSHIDLSKLEQNK